MTAAVFDDASQPFKTTPWGIHAGLTASVASPITAAAANDTVYPPYLSLLQKLGESQAWGVVGWSDLHDLALAFSAENGKLYNIFHFPKTCQRSGTEISQKVKRQFFCYFGK